VCREDADRPTGLHQHRLVALSVRSVRTSASKLRQSRAVAPGAAVDDEVVRRRRPPVEVVLEHAQRTLLRQPKVDSVSPGPLELSRAFHVSRPSSLRQCTYDGAMSNRFTGFARVRPPPRSPERANGRDRAARDGVTRWLTAAVAGDAVSGSRIASARAAPEQLDGDHVSEGLQGFAELARGVPSHGTWSSCMPEDGIESTLAGVAKRFHL